MLGQGIANVMIEPAYSITIPLRPQPMRIAYPVLKDERIELPDTLATIWQEDKLIIHPKKRKKVDKTDKTKKANNSINTNKTAK